MLQRDELEPRLDLQSEAAFPSTGRRSLTGLLLLAGATAFSGCASLPLGERDLSDIPRDSQTNSLLDRELSGLDLNFRNHTFEVSVEQYEASLQRNRLVPLSGKSANFFQRFVTAADPVICKIAKELTEGARTDEQKAQHLLDWVNLQIRYDSVEAGGRLDYCRYPVETLYERTGDCEDTAFLYAALCKAAGLDVVLLDLPGHVAVGVCGSFSGECFNWRGKAYYFAETASTTSERIGEIGEHKGKAVKIIGV